MHDNDLQRLLDREAIHDLLVRYCHAIDRVDRELLQGVYWEDATDDHGSFKGTAAEFIDYACDFLPQLRTQHFLGNSWIRFKSPTLAHGETYVIALHRRPAMFGEEEMVVGARYIDRIEKRGDEWRLADRTVVIDYGRYGSGMEPPRYAGLEHLGGKKPDDPFYRLMPQF